MYCIAFLTVIWVACHNCFILTSLVGLVRSGMEIGDRLATAVGFTSGPGGAGYGSKQALVMHNYCAIGTDGGGPANGTQRAFCDVTDGLTFAARDKDAKRLRTALFMTEFGATSDAPTVCDTVLADDALPLSCSYP